MRGSAVSCITVLVCPSASSLVCYLLKIRDHVFLSILNIQHKPAKVLTVQSREMTVWGQEKWQNDGS